mmetsp:Transcript_6616/g.29132  ORF Transcript_6616/g.29132 Transcript_6616/m.29132 type:complete len:230 (+) Transcript_6616:646-1335(+)
MNSRHPGVRIATDSEYTIVVASSARNVASGTWSFTPSGDPCVIHSVLALTTRPPSGKDDDVVHISSGDADHASPVPRYEPPIAKLATASTSPSRKSATRKPSATSAAIKTAHPAIAATDLRAAASSDDPTPPPPSSSEVPANDPPRHERAMDRARDRTAANTANTSHESRHRTPPLPKTRHRCASRPEFNTPGMTLASRTRATCSAACPTARAARPTTTSANDPDGISR